MNLYVLVSRYDNADDHRTGPVSECPMLSITGDNPLYHTPEDRLPAATSSELLENTAKILGASVTK